MLHNLMSTSQQQLNVIHPEIDINQRSKENFVSDNPATNNTDFILYTIKC